MFRISEKLPPKRLYQLKNTLLSSINGKLPSRNHLRYYETGSSASKKGGFFKYLIYSTGATSVIGGGIIAYAKYDPSFRQKLNEQFPGTDSFIKFILQEEKSYVDNIKSSVLDTGTSVKNTVFKLVGKEDEKEFKSSVSPPPPLIKESTPSFQPTQKEKNTTTSTSSTPKHDNQSRVVETKHDKLSKERSSPASNKSDDYKKYNIEELEKEALNITNQAINAYSSAISDLKEYRNDVTSLIEKSVQKDDHNFWLDIKLKTEHKDRIIEKAEMKAKKAMKKIEHIKLLINDSKIDLDSEVRTQVERNIKNALNDLVYTKALFTQERNDSFITDKFSQKVEESRLTLSKELGLLFPSLIVDSESLVTEEELDLFVLYTCQLLNFYQKELQKLETLGEAKIAKLIEQSKSSNPDVIKGIVETETEKLKRNFAQELMKQELKLKSEFEKELVTNLRRQTEVHDDHLKEIVTMKEKEAERKLKREVTEKLEDMRINYNRQLAKIIGRMKGLDVALKEKVIAEKQAKRSQRLWSACQSLILAISSSTNSKSWEEQLKPLENEITAITKAAAEEDVLVDSVIASIPKEAISRGVFSELALRDRFLNVEQVAYRLANLPEGYASIPAILLSYLQSFLLIRQTNSISVAELANEKVIDVSTLSNYDILNRARYFLDRGDYLQTLRYMNLLRGAARAVASEWINEARIFLETQQAANLLLLHAVNSSSIYLQNSS